MTSFPKKRFSSFENFIFNCWDDKDKILTNIKNKLISSGYVGTTILVIQLSNSLVDFNRNIEWLDGYELDLDFINLLFKENTYFGVLKKFLI